MLDQLIGIEEDFVKVWILIVCFRLLNLNHSWFDQGFLLKEYAVDKSHLSVFSGKIVKVVNSHNETR